jgi:hypothetical protein
MMYDDVGWCVMVCACGGLCVSCAWGGVWDELSVSGRYLHENYPPFFTELEDVVAAAEHLSDSDLLSAKWTHRSITQE